MSSVLCSLAMMLSAPPESTYQFPDDESVFNVQTKFGAKGDGKTDDTAALQAALDATTSNDAERAGIITIPNGIYRVTKTLIVNVNRPGSGVGPWIFGESRDGVIIKLDDNVEGVTAVLRTHPEDEGKTSANWFMRNIRHLTIDVGNNPKTDGIRYMGCNTAIIQDVRIIGHGNIGINAGFISESGPNMIQDVVIEGFDVGIRSAWLYGQTLSRITIKDCRTLGIYVVANVMAIEDLTVTGTPQALHVDFPNDWHWWSGVVALVGGNFEVEQSDKAAIFNRGPLFVRDVTAKGFAHTIRNEDGTEGRLPPEKRTTYIDDKTITEFAFPKPVTAIDSSGTTSLGLPVKREPNVPWENNLKNWVCANDFGATIGDDNDDTAAIQKAIDSAAKNKQTVVYLRGVQRGVKNAWYNLEGEIHVHGSVRMVIGLGFARSLGGRYVVDDKSAPMVKFFSFHSFGGTDITFENRSKSNTMIVESCGGKVIGNGGGDIFITNFSGSLHLQKPGQQAWARHMNAEGKSDTGLVRNDGGTLWIMGTKSEGDGLWFNTTKGGQTEIFGGYEYTNGTVNDDDDRPIFAFENATGSIAAVREVCFSGKPHKVKVRVIHDGKTTLMRKPGTWSLFSNTKK